MSDLIEIGSLDIGDSVSFSHKDYDTVSYNDSLNRQEGYIIAIYPIGKDRCVAWKGNALSIRHYNVDHHSKTELTTWKLDGYVFSEEIYNYDCYTWIPSYIVVKHCNRILSPYQKCRGCDLPAPHVGPNDGNSFVCSSCKFLATL
jgi:hypothetical protein